MTPEEYENLIADVSGLSDNAVFIKPKVEYSEIRTCTCGKKYKLGIPYEFANAPAKDLCDDCIAKLPIVEKKTHTVWDDDKEEYIEVDEE